MIVKERKMISSLKSWMKAEVLKTHPFDVVVVVWVERENDPDGYKRRVGTLKKK